MTKKTIRINLYLFINVLLITSCVKIKTHLIVKKSAKIERDLNIKFKNLKIKKVYKKLNYTFYTISEF